MIGLPAGSLDHRQSRGRGVMQNVGVTSAMIWFGAGAGTMVLLYYAARLSHVWRASGRVVASRSAGRTRLAAVPLDTHIAAEWTDGRRRLDTLLALIEALAASLELEVAKLHRLDTSDPLYDRRRRQYGKHCLASFHLRPTSPG